MQNKSLIILFMTMFMVMLGFGLVIPHLAYYAEGLGANPTKVGFLIAIYSFMQFIFAPIWGRISDRRGRRPILLIGLLGHSASMFLFGMSKTLPTLFLFRAMSGVLSSAVLPTVMTYVADVTSIEERGKGMGLMGAAMALGFVFGPGIGGTFGDRHDLPFFLAGGLSFFTFLFAFISLKESLSLELRRKTKSHWIAPWRSLKHPLTPIFLVGFVATASFSLMTSTFPFFIKDRWSYGSAEMGKMFLVMGVVGIIVQGGLIGRLINRFGEFRIVLVGMLTSAIGIGALPFSVGFFSVVSCITIAGLGDMLMRPANSSWVSKRSKNEHGMVRGIMDSFLILGRVFGPLIGGKLYSSEMPQIPYRIGSAFMLVAIILLFKPLLRVWRSNQ